MANGPDLGEVFRRRRLKLIRRAGRTRAQRQIDNHAEQAWGDMTTDQTRLRPVVIAVSFTDDEYGVIEAMVRAGVARSAAAAVRYAALSFGSSVSDLLVKETAKGPVRQERVLDGCTRLPTPIVAKPRPLANPDDYEDHATVETVRCPDCLGLSALPADDTDHNGQVVYLGPPCDRCRRAGIIPRTAATPAEIQTVEAYKLAHRHPESKGTGLDPEEDRTG